MTKEKQMIPFAFEQNTGKRIEILVQYLPKKQTNKKVLVKSTFTGYFLIEQQKSDKYLVA